MSVGAIRKAQWGRGGHPGTTFPDLIVVQYMGKTSATEMGGAGLFGERCLYSWEKPFQTKSQ